MENASQKFERARLKILLQSQKKNVKRGLEGLNMDCPEFYVEYTQIQH